MEKTRTTVTLAGQQFRLSATESEEYIQNIAAYVNKKIEESQAAYPGLGTSSCVLLAALDLADELQKLKEDYKALDSRIDQLRNLPKEETVEPKRPAKRPFETKAPVAAK